MKKLFLILFVAGFLFSACEGDRGPQGPPGEDGINMVGQTFEYEDVDFDYFEDSNLHSSILEVPGDIEVLESDAILVYRLEVADDTETWSLIPQNFFLDEGIIQFVYNHTFEDVEILIDGNFDLSDLDTGFTQDQVFRFVVIPSDFAETTGIDVSNIEAVMNALDIEENEVQHIRN